MDDKHLSEEDVVALWETVNDLYPRLDHLPSLLRGQVISALLGIWASQHQDEKHREELMQWVVSGARGMAMLVDSGAVKPHLMGVAGSA